MGWFTSLYPVVLEAGDADPGDALVSAKERLRAVPGRGIGYGLLGLEAAPAAEILLQLSGPGGRRHPRRALSVPRVHGSARPQPEPARPPHPPAGDRRHGGRGPAPDHPDLRLADARRETAERLAAAYAGALRQLIRHGRESEEVFTPSDFPKAGLDARGFDKLAALLADSD